MFKSLFTAASGLQCQQTYIDTIANNLANVNTNGFKASQLNFQDLLYQTEVIPGTEVTEGNQAPTGLEVGSGVRIVSSSKLFRQGELEQTGRDLDISINGAGFFRVQMPDGTTAYSRDGAFGLDGSRRIVTTDGKPLADNVTVPGNATSISVANDGKVYVSVAGAAETQQVGAISLAMFANPAGLKSAGDNLFTETIASGAPTLGTPGLSGFGGVRQGYLERSNVDVVTELVRLITAQRAYEINTKAISIADKMLQDSNNLIR
jgi:flagellar basal-body rod protein FlgG